MRRRARLWLWLSPLLAACSGQTLDAGSDEPHGLLPVDERSPVVLTNDGTGNWYGLYAVLLASSGGPRLAGIAINSSSYATSLASNVSGWQTLVAAARDSGLRDIPDPITSDGAPLVRPTSDDIDATRPNDSEGARLIVDVASRLSLPYRPVVVVAGGRLTDIADAYLLDHSVRERVVVVAALGSGTSRRGEMGIPNGELDPWADWIVTQRFRYVQVSAFYDSTSDLPTSALGELPMNPLGALIAAQQPNITTVPSQADQVAILAVGVPSFVTRIERVTVDDTAPTDDAGPALTPSETGEQWLVVQVDPSAGAARLQQMLRDPKTFGG